MAAVKHDWKEAITLLVWRNWITLFGASITTVSASLIVTFLIMGMVGLTGSAYAGILIFMLLPGLFVLGLVLIPVGVIWERRKRRKHPERGADESGHLPQIDFNIPRTRTTALLVALLTLANMIIISTVTYEGTVYMESVQFCGQVCHEVMEPEHTAYLTSPHSRVKCVECHIGPGAPWFVRSKLSGVRQVFAVAFDSHSRPIPTPVPHLRPSQDTCEECHWPAKFTGDRIDIHTHYEEDEANTKLTTALVMHVGGQDAGKGIHSWHIDPNKRTTYYAADDEREDIQFVRVTEADGTVTEYTAAGAEIDPAAMTAANMRTMDCMDCHNRPSHVFDLPAPAMDDAMALGGIAQDLPYIKKVGVEALAVAAEQKEGAEHIADRIQAYYRENHPELVESRRTDIDAAVSAIQAIYARNVFPKMGVTWGTYPNHIGHTDFTGCFRCHDEEHTSPDGAVISQDCTACHTVLAWNEESPEVLTSLGIE